MPNDNQYSNGPEKAKDGSLRESGAGGRVLGGTKFVVGSIIIAGIALVLVAGSVGSHFWSIDLAACATHVGWLAGAAR